jgi:hypothetical protein
VLYVIKNRVLYIDLNIHLLHLLYLLRDMGINVLEVGVHLLIRLSVKARRLHSLLLLDDTHHVTSTSLNGLLSTTDVNLIRAHVFLN